jgi:hypothetical protein
MGHPQGFDFCCLRTWASGLMAALTGYRRLDDQGWYWIRVEED